MIRYKSGSIRFIFRWQGSVFPNTVLWSTTSGALAVLCGFLLEVWDLSDHLPDITGVSNWWAGMTTVLGFLIVFRTQQAHSRYWEGATLVKQAQGELIEAATSLVAFCSTDQRKSHEVVAFQHLLVRLMSMLYSTGLQTISDLDDSHFRMLDWSGVEEGKLGFLAQNRDHAQRCQILHLWVQRVIVESINNGVLPIPTPILSRVFQELSQGAVHLANARKLTEVTFPFPYAQLITVLLLTHWLLSPMLSTLLIESRVWAPILTFCSVLAFWGINCIACELESPFGDDPNDLNLAECADDMNTALWVLLDPDAQAPPRYTFEATSIEGKRQSFRTMMQRHLLESAPTISMPLSELAGPSARPGQRGAPQRTMSLQSMAFYGESTKNQRRSRFGTDESRVSMSAGKSVASGASGPRPNVMRQRVNSQEWPSGQSFIRSPGRPGGLSPGLSEGSIEPQAHEMPVLDVPSLVATTVTNGTSFSVATHVAAAHATPSVREVGLVLAPPPTVGPLEIPEPLTPPLLVAPVWGAQTPRLGDERERRMGSELSIGEVEAQKEPETPRDKSFVVAELEERKAV